MDNKLQTEYISIDKLRPEPTNEVIHNEDQITELSKTIERLGFDVPIVVDETYTILKGHGRYLALMKLKKTEALCIIRTGLSDKEKIALRVSDNQLPNLGYFDDKKLYESMKLISDTELEKIVGFDKSEIEDICGEFDNIEETIKMADKENSEGIFVFHSVELLFNSRDEKKEFLNIAKKLQKSNKQEKGTAVLEALKQIKI